VSTSIEHQILFEDNHLLVINKPAPLATMGVASDQDSLVTLAKQYLKAAYNKPGNVYLGVVSRLDSFVTGVIVLARTSKAASRLSRQFADRSTYKTYWAIVPAWNVKAIGESWQMENWVLKDEANHRMQTVSEQRGKAKLAKLNATKIAQFEDNDLLRIELLTGRKHQIRVQLSSAGFPIVGDRKYGSKRTFTQGIALHSYHLVFEHPTKKEPVSIHGDPPNYWKIGRFGSLSELRKASS